MGIFSKSLDKQLADAKTSREALQSRLITAQQLANDQKAAAQKAARDGDDAALDKAEAKIRTGLIRVDTLIAALAEVDQNIVQLKQQIRDAADKAQRDEADKVIEQCAADLGTVSADLDRALETMCALTGRITPWCIDAMGAHVFTGSAREELSAAVSMLQTILKSGSFPPALVLAKPAPKPAPMPQPAPVMRVCVLKEGVAWLDAAGVVQTAGRGEDIDLSPATAKHAIQIVACCTMTDPRRKMIKQSFGLKIGKPLRRNCIDLDPDMPPDAEREPFSDRRVAAPIRSTPAPLPPGFEVLPNVGPPVQMSVARNDLRSLATRKEEKP